MSKLRIERIIEVKERIMDDKRKEMEALASEIDKITMEINNADSSIEINYNKITATISNSNDIYVIKEYIVYLENRKTQMISQRKDLRASAEVMRSELLELLKEIKMLEVLRTKELKIIKKTQDRREQKMLDELASRISEIK